MLWKSDSFEQGGGLARAAKTGGETLAGQSAGVVLIADDNWDDANHAKMIVEKLCSPPPTRVLSSGEEVFAYLEGREQYADRTANPYPVLLLLDLLMPGTDGFAVLKWLQTHPEHHALPVIVLSVVREFREISKAYQLGARSFLMKPLVLNEIRMALHAMAILPDADLYPESELPKKKEESAAKQPIAPPVAGAPGAGAQTVALAVRISKKPVRVTTDVDNQ